MSNTFIIADTHFGHANSLNFFKRDGSKLRDFSCVEEMDQHMIDRWNSVVRPQDKVIHLGDVVINKKYLKTLDLLNGQKKLIMGNHDLWDIKILQQYFYDIKAYRIFDGCIMSHIPVHTSSLERFKVNVHGHLHSEEVYRTVSQSSVIRTESVTVPDYRYLCCSVEQSHINYTPIAWEDVKVILRNRDVK